MCFYSGIYAQKEGDIPKKLLYCYSLYLTYILLAMQHVCTDLMAHNLQYEPLGYSGFLYSY